MRLIVFEIDDLVVGLPLNMGAFGDGFEMPVFELTDTARDMSVVGERVVERVADHTALLIL